MPDIILKSVYLLGLLLAEAFRFPQRLKHAPVSRMEAMVDSRQSRQERLLLIFLILGVWALPFLYCITPWLSFANYYLQNWLNWLGIGIFGFGLGLRWKAQHDLGKNYSSTLTVWQDHALITEGIYRFIRHPIYAALWLWGIAQPMLLHNWIAGWTGIAAIIPLYMLRVPREEAMLLEHFGDLYRQYMKRTGRVIPLGRRK